MKNILVIKLSDNHINSNKEIIERVRGNWKVSPKRLDGVDYVVVLNNLKVIATYILGNEFIYNRSTGRVGNLQLFENNDLDVIGKEVTYSTSNPATLASYERLFG
ncbi:TPA: hypothetical protein PGC77_002699 [Staphylococcus aureus]|nr:hypothetical protein [Staphylococcus aureus]HDG6898105.1 hypothetical protein [Staphylococcus aureus]